MTPILGFVSFYSLQWYSQEAKQAYVMSEENQIERYIMTEELKWKTKEEINNYPEIIERKNNIENTKKEIELYKSTLGNSTLLTLIPIIVVIFVFIILWISTTAYIKRLHDLNKSGWLVLINFIPFISLILFIYCGFFKWTSWNNRFGPNPLGLNNDDEL